MVGNNYSKGLGVMTKDEARSKIIFALDVDSFADAKHWVSVLSGHVGMFKVGKQLFTSHGPDVVRMVETGLAGARVEWA